MASLQQGGHVLSLVHVVMPSQWFVRVFLIIWAVSLTAVGAALMVSHWVPLPSPQPGELVFSDNLPPAATGQWVAVHCLYAECPCSRRVLDHVITRPPRTDVFEHIVLVGNAAKTPASVKHWRLSTELVSPEQFKSRYGLEAAPLLVVLDPDRQVRYVGGYTERKQGFNIQVDQILTRLLAGEDVQSLPVYGCAVSKGLQALVDPLRIKSSSRD